MKRDLPNWPAPALETLKSALGKPAYYRTLEECRCIAFYERGEPYKSTPTVWREEIHPAAQQRRQRSEKVKLQETTR
jgi:hypothetical protein